MKKIWLKGEAYELTDEQFDAMNDYVNESIANPNDPNNKGTRKLHESEDVAVEFLEAIEAPSQKAAAKAHAQERAQGIAKLRAKADKKNETPQTEK